MRLKILLKSALLFPGLLTLLVAGQYQSGNQNPEDSSQTDKPNIIFIMADDLGYGDLGSYNQEHIQTPNLDRLAKEGTVFTQYYSGSTVCAPSRASLMTGLHMGHSPIRGNVGWERGDMPLRSTDTTFVERLDEAGYITGMFGKWSLGLKGTSGAPSRKGFDAFFGYEDQSEAHSYYMDKLQAIRQGVTVNVDVDTTQYTHDLFVDATLDFIEQNKESPFFLYLPYAIPHAELKVPEESMKPYLDKDGQSIFPEPTTNESTIYNLQDNPLATYAAMVSRLDRGVGRIRSKLEKLGLDDDTIIFFTSDNGPHSEGGYDPEYFDSNGPLRGQKRDLYEGGIRVPMIAWGPGYITSGQTSNQIWSAWDVAPTILDFSSIKPMDNIDGISVKKVLTGETKTIKHPYLYWEFSFRQTFMQAVRINQWKAIKFTPEKGPSKIELYNLEADLDESNDLSGQYPQKSDSLGKLMNQAHTIPDHSEFRVPWIDS